MKFRHHPALRCPLDQLPLQETGQQLRCDNGHSYDIARQGYVNLLGPGDKRSRDPGDSKDMVAARGAFLDAGHYLPIVTALAALLRPLLTADSVIVDAGCGEGYYLAQLKDQLHNQFGFANGTPALIGFDISKWAIQSAARRPVATWLVASNRRIPLAAGSADCVLSLFGFPVFDGFKTLLKDGGTLLLASAGPRHLIELREILYPTVRHSESSVEQQAVAAGLVPGASTTLKFTTAPLSRMAIAQLLGMTPHLFRASQPGKARAAQLDQFPVTVDVQFQCVRKADGQLQ